MAQKQDLGIARDVVTAVAGALFDLGFAPAAALKSATVEVVPGSSADALFDGAAAALGREALAIDLTRRLPLGSLGIVDYALFSAPTMREGLRRLTRFYGILSQRMTVELVEEERVGQLVFHRAPGAQHSRHWIEFASAAITDRLRQSVGPQLRYERVAFLHPPPSSRTAHEAYFEAPVEFGAPKDVLVFPAALLDSPLKTAAAALGSVLEARMKELEPGRAASDAYVDRVRRAVVELLDREDPQLESVVARLGTARRTLQRELQQRGTSHKEILDDVRRARALQLLEDSNLTVTEVAYRLGFSEPSAFFRAFRRWTGKSPKAAVGKRPASKRPAGKRKR